MIKYFECNSFDEYGQNIIPVTSSSPLIKTASGSYSPELMKVIMAIKRSPEYYYVVINAVGAYEFYGANRNGDSFPMSGLMHKCLRTDMGTDQEYGYKTFEYLAKLYKHHVNKNPKESFGDVIFSHWNDKLRRVELIVGINREKAPDIVSALDNGENVAVSMGCRVKYDRCSICGNKSATRDGYCKHLKNYLRQLVDESLARQWSRETGKNILPGMVVCAFNDYPKFFDISKVYIGADRTAYILGKAASSSPVISGVDMAEAYGVTDAMIDKISALGKRSEINKEVGGDALSSDGEVVAIKKSDALRKAIDATVQKTIESEPRIPNDVLDPIAETYPMRDIFSTMFRLGIHPKPVEAQRIVIISINRPDVANYLDDNNMCFDHQAPVQEAVDFDLEHAPFNDIIAKALTPYIEKRSAFASFLEPRMMRALEKRAETNGFESIINNDDYWTNQRPQSRPLMVTSQIPNEMKVIGGLASIYAGLKLTAAGYSPKMIAEAFTSRPWLRNMLAGGMMLELMNKMISGNSGPDPYIMRPAREYANVLQDTKFSGHLQKYSSAGNALGLGLAAGAVALPGAYIMNSYNQKSLAQTGRNLYPFADAKPSNTAIGAGAITAAGTLLYDKLKKGKFR